jgi:hypothetical protein
MDLREETDMRDNVKKLRTEICKTRISHLRKSANRMLLP